MLSWIRMQSTRNDLYATSKVASKWQAGSWRDSDAECQAALCALVSIRIMVRSGLFRRWLNPMTERFVFNVMVERRLDICMAAQSGKALSFELTCTGYIVQLYEDDN